MLGKHVFVQRNDELIPIEYVEDEHDSSRDFTPSFWFENRRYYLDDFARVHNNPWIYDDFPDYIHGMQNDGSHQSYTHPLFIELIGDTELNVYTEEMH